MSNNLEKSFTPEPSLSDKEKIKLQFKRPEEIELYEGGAMKMKERFTERWPRF